MERGHLHQQCNVDYWMVHWQDLKLVSDTKVIPYNSVAPQHRLLVLDIQMDQLHQTRKPTTRKSGKGTGPDDNCTNL